MLNHYKNGFYVLNTILLFMECFTSRSMETYWVNMVNYELGSKFTDTYILRIFISMSDEIKLNFKVPFIHFWSHWLDFWKSKIFSGFNIYFQRISKVNYLRTINCEKPHESKSSLLQELHERPKNKIHGTSKYFINIPLILGKTKKPEKYSKKGTGSIFLPK